MRTIVIVSKAAEWPLQIAGVDVVLASDYLIDPQWMQERNLRVYNLARSYRYQTGGYYVSLLATARRQRVFPDLMTVLDMKSRDHVRSVGQDLEALIDQSLADLKSEHFELSVYFGRNVAKRHDRLARRLFAEFPSPLLRAHFRRRGTKWALSRIGPIAYRDVPEGHEGFVLEAAREHFARPRFQARTRRSWRYDMAILHDPEEELAPSDPKALARFRTAAEKVGFGVEMIRREDFGRIGEFDALFIRETTAVDHHTFRFAHRAQLEGLVVIDDPRSIVRCTNKIYQAEAFEVHGVPTPKTLITDQVDPGRVEREIGYPCVLKVPDSAFSQGVVRCADADQLLREGTRFLAESDLLLIQEFTPSEFDWRIGVFDGEVLFACRYLMARGHWQIIAKTAPGRFRYGRVETVPTEAVPPRVLRTALKAAASIGDGLYGVDVKHLGRRVLVMEVNDNPNLDAGSEDAILGADLYRRIMTGFLDRVEARKRANA